MNGANDITQQRLRKRQSNPKTENERAKNIQEPPAQLFQMHRDLIQNLDARINIAVLADPKPPRIIERTERRLSVLRALQVCDRKPQCFETFGQAARTNHKQR